MLDKNINTPNNNINKEFFNNNKPEDLTLLGKKRDNNESENKACSINENNIQEKEISHVNPLKTNNFSNTTLDLNESSEKVVFPSNSKTCVEIKEPNESIEFKCPLEESSSKKFYFTNKIYRLQSRSF